MRYFKIILFCIILSSCGNTTNKTRLEKQVLNDLKVEFSKTAKEQNINYSIESFGLVHLSGNEYSGLLETIEDDVKYTYKIYAVTDGDNYVWEIVE